MKTMTIFVGIKVNDTQSRLYLKAEDLRIPRFPFEFPGFCHEPSDGRNQMRTFARTEAAKPPDSERINPIATSIGRIGARIEADTAK